MPLSVNDKFGPYEILSFIGAGGMGEVYRARDTRLGREVAIKILPEEFARNQDRMRRFDQEARAVAALNHPNVLSIFDTGVKDGVPYLVSELLEGESLRQRLEQGPIPPRKAVDFARQIADGLAAAHEKNVVHRDLKPENLFLTTGGRVKILDFGLAKQAPDSAPMADGATATLAGATNPGVVMGTAGYMAPEQVRGQAVDHRADIFSFGAVLYEMLSGRRAFHRDTAVETLNAILKEEPAELDVRKLHVAPGLERIVHHCLEKKPAERFQSARDLTFALASLSDTSSEQRAAVPAASSTHRRWIGLGAAVLFAVGAAILTLVVMPRREAEERLDFAIPVHGEVSHLAISQDGKWLAYVSPGDSGLPRIYVQRVGSSDVRVLPGTESASYPFWSPDGKYVAFFANYKMQKVALAGGDPQTIIPVGGAPRGGAWSSKGVIIYSRDAGGPLWRVNADGSGEALLTDKIFRSGLATHRFPAFLPDGDHFLMLAASFAEVKGEGSNTIILSSLSKLEAADLISATSSAGFGGGRMYYVDADGALVSAKLDLSRGKLDGPAKQMASHVARSPSTYYGAFTVSNDETVIFSANSTPSQSQLTWFDESGKELGRIGAPGVLANPAISPDGKRVAFDSQDLKANNIDVWISDLERGSSSRFTFDPVEESTPIWSRNGSVIAYRKVFPLAAVQLKKANGLEPDHALTVLPDQADDIIPNSWPPGDREVLGTFQPGKGAYKLMLIPVDGSKPRILFNGSGNQTNGQFSPDGKWVAYASNESGNWEIYVTNYPGAAGKWQVSRGGGMEPRWSGDGKAIFYIAPGQMLTRVQVTAGDTFSAAVPRPLFQIHTRAPISSTDLFNYDVARDGKRFLVNQYIKPEQPPPLNIILHAGAGAPK